MPKRSRFCLNRIISPSLDMENFFKFRQDRRVLIGPKDVMGNQAQISALEDQGYSGFYSFEPFSSRVQQMSIKELSKALDKSLDLIQCLA